MRARGSNNILLGFFFLLAVGSIELKASSSTARNRYEIPGSQIEAELVRSLRSQGFATAVRPRSLRSPIVYAERSSCRLAVRDARRSEAYAIVFAEEAETIGPIRYLYSGKDYAALPTFAVRIGRIQTELFALAGLKPHMHIPVALASSPSCGRADFGLRDVRILR